MRLNSANRSLYSNNLYTDRLLQRKMNQIKEKFFEYLEENDTSGKIDADELLSKDVSIFQYEEKFKQFLQSNAADLGYSIDFILENIESDDKEVEGDKKSEEDEDTEEDFDAKTKLLEFMDADDEEIPDELPDEDIDPDDKKESIFDYAEEFNKFLTEDEEGLKINEQYAFNFAELSNFEYDEETGKFITNEETTKEQQKMLNYISEMLLNEDIKKFTDADEDGKVSKEEMLEYLSSLNEYDEDKDYLTLRDMFTGYNEIVNSKTPTDDDDTPPVDDPVTDDDTDPHTPADDPGKPNSVSPGSSGPSASPGSSFSPTGSDQYYNESPKITRTTPNEASEAVAGKINEIDKQIAAKNKEINSLNEDKAKAYESESEYTTLVGELTEATNGIDTSVANLSKLNSAIHLGNITYETKKAELDNLQDPKVITQLQPQIDAKRESLKSELQQLETAKNNLQTKINDETKKLKEYQAKKDKAQQGIDKFEQEHPKSEVTTINSKIAQLNTDIQSLEAQKTTIKAELEKTQQQEIDDGKVYGLATAYRESNEFVKFMMDYATDPAIREYYDKNEIGQWCARFTSEITEKMFDATGNGLGIALHKGSQDLGGSEMAMNAIAYAKKYQGDYARVGLLGLAPAKGKGAAYVDNIQHLSDEEKRNLVRSGKVYPGMTFEYRDPATGAYHTGFIESINPDLTWNTIEGNSTGGKTGQHVRDGSYRKLADVVDTSFTAYYLAIVSGKMTVEEANSRLYYGAYKSTFG